MDPSAFIFVGLAVAWLAYLVPKALEHHDAGDRSRSVSTFSHKLRVLARREPVDRRRTQLVPSRRPGAAEPAAEAVAEAVEPAEPAERAASAEPAAPALDAETTGFFAAQTFVRRSAASRAVKRRRRVLGTILVMIAMVAAVAAGRVISWWWVTVPVALLAAWLVACRLMVRQERAVRRPDASRAAPPRREPTPAAQPGAPGAPGTPDGGGVEDAETSEVPVVRADLAEPVGDGWELVPVTLPTYVSKPKAHRTVSTIDLDSTGVWTSGRTAADSALAQRADAVRAPEAEAPSQQRRVSGA